MSSLTSPQRTDSTLIVGLGKTGLSCARYLRARGQAFSLVDSRDNPPGLAELRRDFPQVPCHTGGFPPELFAAAQRLILSPGVALAEPQVAAALARGAEVIGDIELFAREVRAPLAAITGSNGKSTVTSLLGQMLEAQGLRGAVGGNLGQPALDLLAADREVYVMELSSFQLETTHSLRPRVAVVLNISPDHLDRYADMASYIAAKAVIYANAEVRLFNRDDPVVAALCTQPAASDRWFGLGEPLGETDFGLRPHGGENWLWRGDEPWIAASRLAIPGRHNLANALAALAMGEALGLAREAMLKALVGFTGLPHRTQLVAAINGVRWYNDSKGTNPGASAAALEGFAGETGVTLLIAGGDGKGADFGDLAQVVAAQVGELILIGRDAPLIAAAVAQRVNTHFAASMAEAVDMARQLARPGDRVLLSPACASFDMFDHYEQRGEVFTALVQGLAP